MLFKKFAMLFLAAVILLSACSPSTPAAQAPEVQAAPSNTPKPTDTATPTLDLAATQSAQQTADAAATEAAEATEKSAKETAAVEAKNATATQKAGVKLTATAVAAAEQEAQLAAFQTVLDDLQAQGLITNTEGELVVLDDFEREMAKLYYWDPVITDYKVNNFVLDADIEYGSASDTADWLWSGCGFVYGLQDPYNYTVAWVALDGNVYATHVLKGDLTGKFLTWKRWGKPDLPTGTAKVRIVVFDKRLTIFVNDQKVTSAYDGLTEPGEFAMLVLSGTNKGYGTRCKMSNLNLWMFDE